MIGWLGKSFIGMACFVPYMLMFNFLGKNYGAKPEGIVLAWFLGTAIGIGAFYHVRPGGNGFPVLPLLVVLVLGITIGAAANVLIGQATVAAPNPALPFTVVNAASAATFLLAPVVAVALPRFFDPMSFSFTNLAGIALVVAGLGLVAYR